MGKTTIIDTRNTGTELTYGDLAVGEWFCFTEAWTPSTRGDPRVRTHTGHVRFGEAGEVGTSVNIGMDTPVIRLNVTLNIEEA